MIFLFQGKSKGQLALSASQASSKKRPSSSSAAKKSASAEAKAGGHSLNLKERLTQQLVTGQAECMVCLEKIRPKNATWHCDGECFQVFHIHCIKKWSKIARTEDQGGWRCPGRQSIYVPFLTLFCMGVCTYLLFLSFTN